MSDIVYTKAAVDALRTADAATYLSKVAPPTLDGVARLRAAIRGGAVTSTAPIVGIGDSHTDVTTAAQYLWQRLQNVGTLPGNGLEGVPATAIIPRGNNGQKLADYLHNNTASNTLAAALALNPVAIIACWLTNDVRQGGLGLTVAAIRVAGAALLNELITTIAGARPGTSIILRVPFPFTTVDGGEHYITDGSATNPAGLAQIYTDGVRLAYYDALRAHPEVVLYDPQTRLAGTVSPTANGGYYGNQIHQSQGGYWAEADDFAAFISAQQPYQAARSYQAMLAAPAAPWTVYHRDCEDSARYVKVFEGLTGTATAGQTYLDMESTVPAVAAPGNLAEHDIVVLYAARTAVEVPGGSSYLRQSDTVVRVLLSTGSLPTVQDRSRVAIYRRITGTDPVVNTVLYDKSWRYKRYGRVGAGSTGYVDLVAAALTADPVVIPMADAATTARAGDLVYIEGHGASPITLVGGDFAANGSSFRIFGGLPDSFDYSTVVGKMAVIVGTHAG